MLNKVQLCSGISATDVLHFKMIDVGKSIYVANWIHTVTL